MTRTMSKLEAYQYLDRNGAGFVANVVWHHYANPAKKLKGLAKLVFEGKDVRFAEFSMDILLVDGLEVDWDLVEGYR